jgi:hypothetical protein
MQEPLARFLLLAAAGCCCCALESSWASTLVQVVLFCSALICSTLLHARVVAGEMQHSDQDL